MSKITDYSFLFQSMFGTKKTNPIGSFRLSQLNSGSVQAQLRAAGIDTKAHGAVHHAGGRGIFRRRNG